MVGWTHSGVAMWRRGLGVSVLVALVVVSCFAAGNGGDKTFLWKVTREGNTVYLLGSMHLAQPEIYPLDEAITSAYEGSAFLAVEVDMKPEDQAEVAQMVMEQGYYQDGTELRDHLSDTTWKRLEAFADAHDYDLGMFGGMKPWVVGLTITALEVQKLGFDPQAGLDQHFLTLAREDGTPIKELESIEEQIGLLASFADRLQEMELLRTLDELAELRPMMERMADAWRTGDAAAMEAVMMEAFRDNPELEPLYDQLIVERNASMTETVESYLAAGKRHFVVVGAGHLVGDDGIVARLERAGHTVRQVEARGRLAREAPAEAAAGGS